MKKNLLKVVSLVIVFNLIISTHYSILADYKEAQIEPEITDVTTLETQTNTEVAKTKKKTNKKKTTKKKTETKKEEKQTTETVEVTPKTPVEKIDTSITSDSNFANEFNPQNVELDDGSVTSTIAKPVTNAVVSVVNIALGVIQTLGGLLMIVSIAIFGFYMVAMSHGPLAADLGIGGKRGNMGDSKVALLNFGRSLLIGSVLLFLSSTIVRFVFNIFTT